MTLFEHFASKRLIIVGGKGGVGKTTIAAALSIMISQTHKTLVVSTDPAHSLSDSFRQSIGSEITKLSEKYPLFGLEISAEDAYRKFIDRYRNQLKLLFDSSTYFDEEDINEMLSVSIPGLDEVMSLKTIIDLLTENQFDRIIIDTAPTGHALRLLSMPDVLDTWIKMSAKMRWKYKEVIQTFKGSYTPDEGDDFLVEMKKSVKRIEAILKDKNACEFLPVMIPTEMSFAETERLILALQQEGINAEHLFINQVLPPKEAGIYFAQKVKEEQALIKRIQSKIDLTLHLVEQEPLEVRGMERLFAFASKNLK
ncbi:MAG: ArsA family ATPase [Chloroherpetonaceae bacterium]|nr:ArsA family ATPase [Chloroherpetonaceae bacterium]